MKYDWRFTGGLIVIDYLCKIYILYICIYKINRNECGKF